MPTPTYFPQCANGTSTQLPYSFRPAFASVVSDMPTGKRYSYARLQAPLGNWDVNFPAITDANLATMEAFFAQQQGRLQSFTFLDPAGNLAQYSEDFTQSAWVKTTLTLGSVVVALGLDKTGSKTIFGYHQGRTEGPGHGSGDKQTLWKDPHAKR